ncbi:HSP20-like chaperone [Nemania sp. FL0916]|nr:HSP20-like chaperone [Nemania sp. FL0916]
MSVFTHHPFYAAPSNDFSNFGNFGGLVRFIDDWDKHFSSQHNNNNNSRDGQSQSHSQPARQARRNVQTFTPRFDVRETEQNYELHGELPGVEKKDISIEFSDLQTIVIRGSVERTYTEGNVPAPAAGLLTDAPTANHAIVPSDVQSEDSAETRSNKSFQATVEDEKEEGEGSVATTGAVVETPRSETPSQLQVQPQQPQQLQQKKAKYWVHERSVGNFLRSFTFSNRVDNAAVSASLDNGILTVVVPKAKKPETRRIAIN